MNRRTVSRRFGFGVALVLGVTVACACWPRTADLRCFEPAEIARLETAMWRDYYEKRYGALFYHLCALSRTQFGFSPFDSLRITWAAAQAASAFQPTRSREAANAALPAGFRDARRCRRDGTPRARPVAGAARSSTA